MRHVEHTAQLWLQLNDRWAMLATSPVVTIHMVIKEFDPNEPVKSRTAPHGGSSLVSIDNVYSLNARTIPGSKMFNVKLFC